MSGSFWYCRQWTHLTRCLSILKQVVNPRKKSKPTAICLLCSLSKAIQSPEAFFFVNNNKKKNMWKLFSILECFYSCFKENWKNAPNESQLIPNWLSIIWNFSSPCFYQCCLSFEPSDCLLWSASWLIKVEKGKLISFHRVLLTGFILTSAKSYCMQCRGEWLRVYAKIKK